MHPINEPTTLSSAHKSVIQKIHATIWAIWNLVWSLPLFGEPGGEPLLNLNNVSDSGVSGGVAMITTQRSKHETLYDATFTP